MRQKVPGLPILLGPCTWCHCDLGSGRERPCRTVCVHHRGPFPTSFPRHFTVNILLHICTEYGKNEFGGCFFLMVMSVNRKIYTSSYWKRARGLSPYLCLMSEAGVWNLLKALGDDLQLGGAVRGARGHGVTWSFRNKLLKVDFDRLKKMNSQSLFPWKHMVSQVTQQNSTAHTKLVKSWGTQDSDGAFTALPVSPWVGDISCKGLC